MYSQKNNPSFNFVKYSNDIDCDFKHFFSITFIECSLENKSIEFEFKFDFSYLKLKNSKDQYHISILDEENLNLQEVVSPDEVYSESILNPVKSYIWLFICDNQGNLLYANKFYLFNYKKYFIKIIDNENYNYSLHESLPLNKTLIALIHNDFEIQNFPTDQIYYVFNDKVKVLYEIQNNPDCSLMLGSMLYGFKFDETTQKVTKTLSTAENFLNTQDLLLSLMSDYVCDDIEDNKDEIVEHHLSNNQQTEQNLQQNQTDININLVYKQTDEIQKSLFEFPPIQHNQIIFQPKEYIINGDLKDNLFIKINQLLQSVRNCSQSQNYRRISLIECNLNPLDIDFIFRQYSLADEKSSDMRYHHVFKTYTYRQIKGLIFLAYITYCVRKELSVDKIWKDIVRHLIKVNYKKYAECFHDATEQYRPHVLHFIKDAVKAFNLRHAFDEQDQNVYRNTILLQIGILNDIDNLHYWLANYRQPLHFVSLLEINHANYASNLDKALNLLRNYRRKLCSTALVIQELSKNSWFKSLNLEDILAKSTKEYDKNLKGFLSLYDDLIQESEDFVKVQNIQFSAFGEITFFVQLDCSQLEFNPEDNLEIKIFDQHDKLMISFYYERKVFTESFKNPNSNDFKIKLYNQSKECLFSKEFQLFDYNNDLIKIFDQYGTVYNFEDNLNSNKSYHILMHSDFETNLKNKEIYKIFDNNVKLLTNVSVDDHCELYLDGETIQLNFGTSNQKIENFPHQDLVMIGTIQSNDSIDFDVYALNQTKDGTIPLDPNIKLLNFKEYADLKPEHYLMSKKTIQLLYKNKLFVRQAKVMIGYAKNHNHRKFFVQNLISNEIQDFYIGTNKQLKNILNKYELDQYLTLFLHSTYESECSILDNNYHLRDALFRTSFKLHNTTGYGETISIDIPDQNNFYFIGKVINQGIVQSYNTNLIYLNQYVETLEYLNILLLVKTNQHYELKMLNESEFTYQSSMNLIQLNLESKYEVLSGVILNKNQYAGSFFSDDFPSEHFFKSLFKEPDQPIFATHSSFNKLVALKNNAIPLNFNLKDMFAFVKLSFLDILDSYINEFKHILMFKYPLEFLEVFLSEHWEFENNKIYYHYPTNINNVIEHLMYNMKFEPDIALNIINYFQNNYHDEWISKLSSLPFLFLNLIDAIEDQFFKRNLRAVLYQQSGYDEKDSKNIEYIEEISHFAKDLINRKNSKNEFNLKLRMHSLKEQYFLLYKYLC